MRGKNCGTLPLPTSNIDDACSPRAICAVWPSAVLVSLITLSILTAALMKIAAAETPRTLVGHGGPVRAISVAADRGTILTASFDYSIIQWSFNDDEAQIAQRLTGHDAAVNDVVFAASDNLAVSASDDGTVGLWDLEKGTLLHRFEGHDAKVLEVAVTSDGRYAASAGWDQTARLWDLVDQKPAAVLNGHRGNVNSVAFSTDDKTVFTGSYDGSIRSWSVERGAFEHVIYRHGWGINVVRVLADGRHLLFGALDGTVGLIEIETGEFRELAKHVGPALSAAVWTKNNLAAVGGGDGTIRVWNTRTWDLLHIQENAYGPVWALALSPDGTTIYRAGLDDFVVGWTISPHEVFEQPASVYPRRFQLTEDISLGERQFFRKCSICHTLEPDGGNRAGPTLYGVFGRRAGSVKGYPYSPGLKSSKIIWNTETIGQLFDLGPDVVTPGSKMPLQRLKSVEARDELIAFLKVATAPEKRDIVEDNQ